MIQSIDAIYEGGVLKPLTTLALPDKQRVRLIVETPEQAAPSDDVEGDPLAGLRCDMGVADLAQNFDDYRFGRRQL
jgi:hypothetical protein